MKEVHRYKVVKMLSEDGNRISYDPHGPEVVLAPLFDSALAHEAALREELRLAKGLQTTTNAIVDMVDGQRDYWIEKHNVLQQRLSFAEQQVGELVAWSCNKPSTPGAYWIRGFNLSGNTDQSALVHVVFDEDEQVLMVNLHQSTTETDTGYWYEVDDINQVFEWCGPLYAEQPAPVAVVLPFAEEVIAKLQRFEAYASDGQDVDIGRHWFDLLTQLELLRRVQRSPAYWEMTQQGQDVLVATRLNTLQ